MRKRVTQKIEVELAVCNICGKEVGGARIFAQKRIEVVRGLMKTTDFDAHDACINRIIRQAFEPYTE